MDDDLIDRGFQLLVVLAQVAKRFRGGATDIAPAEAQIEAVFAETGRGDHVFGGQVRVAHPQQT